MIINTEFGQTETAKLTQRMLEDFNRQLRERVINAADITDGKTSFNEYAGAVVRVAVAVGWLVEFTEADVSNMEALKVAYIYWWIDSKLRELMEIDPNWSRPLSSAPGKSGRPQKS